jgi:dTDP-4-dehydrorhamnose reductase
MDVLVLGVSGMLGSMVFRLLGERPNWRVVGTARSPAIRGRFAAGAEIRTDVAVEDLAGLAGLLRDIRPAVVINCIGVVKQAAASRDPLHALPVNALFPHQLARLCDLGGSRLVHISTDCVFSGRAGNYREADYADADDIYGRSKLLGEVDAPNAITLRTSIVGPEPAGVQGFGLLEWFLKQPGPVKGYAKAIFSGLTTPELTHVIADFVLPRPELTGVYHVSAAPISKYDLLGVFAAAYGRSFAIERDEGLVIDRSLDSSRFRGATGYVPPDWPSMVAAMRSIDRREEGTTP